jgi:arsenite methyltransferase
MVWSELGEICEKFGLSVPYMQTASPYKFGDNVQELLGDTKFAAVTWRIMKKPDPSKTSEGSFLATYNGEIEEICTFQLAQTIKFPKSKPVPIYSEIFAELESSRYAKFFNFEKIEDIKPQQLNPFDFI